ncbi:TRAP transporter small permease [Photobacterium satsumensis]|uniref:TRAP transporter small permease n=1 Tax=Photobacterium satsumensis TaxID=2910239 RepID=UPI003D14C2CA
MNSTILDKLLQRVGMIECSIAVSLLAFTVLGILTQVVLRTVFNSPIAWIEEALTYAFIWLVFISASYAWKKKSHIRIDAIFILFSKHEKVILILEIFVSLLMISLLTIMATHLLDIIPLESRMKTIALPVRLPKSYFYSIPLFISTISMLITSMIYLFKDCQKLFQREDKEVLSCQ